MSEKDNLVHLPVNNKSKNNIRKPSISKGKRIFYGAIATVALLTAVKTANHIVEVNSPEHKIAAQEKILQHESSPVLNRVLLENDALHNSIVQYSTLSSLDHLTSEQRSQKNGIKDYLEGRIEDITSAALDLAKVPIAESEKLNTIEGIRIGVTDTYTSSNAATADTSIYINSAKRYNCHTRHEGGFTDHSSTIESPEYLNTIGTIVKSQGNPESLAHALKAYYTAYNFVKNHTLEQQTVKEDGQEINVLANGERPLITEYGYNPYEQYYSPSTASNDMEIE